jgi:hypothetical protein
MADEELEKERKLFAVALRAFSGSAFLSARLSCLARPKPLRSPRAEEENDRTSFCGLHGWR